MSPKRVSEALAFALAAVCLASVSALAAGNPGRAPYAPGDDVFINCPQGFVGVLHTIVDKEYIKTFTAADGTVRFGIEGRLLETFTGNGKSVTVNDGGPATIIVSGGSVTVVTQGRTMIIPRALDGLWVYTGLVNIDPGTGAILSHHGGSTDLCALLS
jgi:hypothetical protein